MSRIDELIAELFPKGVTRLVLGRICEIQRGVRVTKGELLPEGRYPVVSGGTGHMGYLDRFNRTADTITIAQYGTAGYVNWQREDFWANDICFTVIPDDEQVINKYLYYFLVSRQVALYQLSNRIAVPYSIDRDKILNIEIQLPPLEVQREIVGILDQFTELEAALEAELETRRKQYEYYRNELLTFPEEGVRWVPMGEVCSDFIVPMRDRPKVFDGDIPWCRIEDIDAMSIQGSKIGLGVSEDVIQQMNLKVMPQGTVIASCSASLGRYAINTVPLITNQTFIGLVCGPNLHNRFLLHLLFTKTEKLRSQSTTGTIAYISRQKFEELLIPVPPIDIQREIVRILDQFTELEAGLEAELEARRKQYEYYRDKLLTFPEAVA
jgi:type I restriction enzyme S subunit